MPITNTSVARREASQKPISTPSTFLQKSSASRWMAMQRVETALDRSPHPGDVVMKSLIVNGDDFGASPAINRGIKEAHRRGILTSTSLLVKAEWAEEAAALGRAAPDLSVGL